jgi:hypothetical protein
MSGSTHRTRHDAPKRLCGLCRVYRLVQLKGPYLNGSLPQSVRPYASFPEACETWRGFSYASEGSIAF